MYIYKITNDINKKVYIGRTTRSLKSRWLEHIKCAENNDNRHIYCAMRKYGIDHFKIECVCECSSIEELSDMEKYYCDVYDSYLNGYNMTAGGESNPMDFEKSRESHIKKMQSKEVRDKISRKMKIVREKSSKYIYIHKDYEEKRIDPVLLNEYIDQGWISGAIKGKIRLHKLDGSETTVFEKDLDAYLKDGWIRGGKPGRLNEEHKRKLANSHKNISDKFRFEQSERLKDFYKNNPDWKTKSKKVVIIINPDTSEIIEFDSCLNLTRFIGLDDKIARSGMVGRWVKLGYINKKDNLYYKWEIKYK